MAAIATSVPPTRAMRSVGTGATAIERSRYFLAGQIPLAW
jgi:hypothetical protein